MNKIIWEHHFRRFYKIVICFLAVCSLALVFSSVSAHADQMTETVMYTNEDTGYSVVVDDAAGLFERSEIESDLLPEMEAITAYGNVALATTDSNGDNASSYAQDFYREWFGTDSGTVFLIDMANRELYIFSDGEVYRGITTSIAYTITDNVYTKATDGDYVGCAATTFEQIYDQLEGRAIAAPMRHISALLLAIGIGLLVAFIWTKYDTVTSIESSYEVMKYVKSSKKISKPDRVLIHRYITNKKFSSGGGVLGGSGGGGGSSSGGGGGHSF